MQLHFDVADALHEPVTTGQQFVSVTVAGESDAIVATRRFEAREPWRLSSLVALKKRLECFLYAPQHILSTVAAGKTEVACFANLGQLSGCGVVVYSFVVCSMPL